MSTPIKDHWRVADADPATQRAQDSMVQLVRQGQDVSLRALQVWADVARKLGATPRDKPADATTVCLAYDPLEKLLEAQREVVDELVATQRQLVQRCVTVSVGDKLAPR